MFVLTSLIVTHCVGFFSKFVAGVQLQRNAALVVIRIIGITFILPFRLRGLAGIRWDDFGFLSGVATSPLMVIRAVD